MTCIPCNTRVLLNITKEICFKTDELIINNFKQIQELITINVGQHFKTNMCIFLCYIA